MPEPVLLLIGYVSSNKSQFNCEIRGLNVKVPSRVTIQGKLI